MIQNHYSQQQACCSDCHGEDRHDTEEGLSSELHRDETVLLRLPVGRGSRLQTGAVILHYDASNCVLEWLLQLG